MRAMTLADVAAACTGRVDAADPSIVVRGVTIDSRTAKPGDLFCALPGERTDGHAFAKDAAARGAAAVLACEDVPIEAVPSVRVADVAAAMMRLGAAVRSASTARVVAITGSSGKTSTRHLVAIGAAARFRTAASEASYNNELGVPLTLCLLEDDTEVLVAEIGSRGRGHIAAMMPAVRPDIAVVTNVGPAHFEMFGSLDGTAAAKAELVEALTKDGTAVLNADDARVRAMAARTPARVVTFGFSEDADMRAHGVEMDAHGRARFTATMRGEDVHMELSMYGEHMVPNALAALAVADTLGVPLGTAGQAIAQAPPVSWRMEIIDGPDGITIVNDAYNSNPASAAAALKTLAALRAGGRRAWAVLGEMAELGPIAHDEHDRLGRLAVRLGIERLIAVGEAARPVCEAARLECMTPDEALWVADAETAVSVVRENVRPGDVVLVKGSRIARLERVVDALTGASA